MRTGHVMDDTTLLSVRVTPKTPTDRINLNTGLAALATEDPTLRVRTEEATGDVTIASMGELHLEIIIDRLAREFHVESSLSRPQVAYKETLTRPADGEMKYAGQTEGRGYYGHVKLHTSPGRRGSGYVFESAIVRGSIPNEFIQPIDEGVREALAQGVLAGYPIVDVRVELYDGSYHDIDSSEAAFTIAGSMALWNAAKKARPVLLQPVMRVQVTAPQEYISDIASNLTSRRGHIESYEDRGRTQVVLARVPFSEMLGYARELRNRTRGIGTFFMQLDQYEPIDPANDGDGGRGAYVSAPHRPSPSPRDLRVALPEPDEDQTEK